MKRTCIWLMVLLSLVSGSRAGLASGPRYVTGPPYFLNQGRPIPWAQSNVRYSTDPGGLSAAVNHEQADALVAAAAAVWSNVPVANIALTNGGTLAEHVSSANAYLGPGGMVFPADVQSANYASVPIAVIYDTDGSVTETLLGAGASSPGSCRQNGVTESVDRFDPVGYIQHAIIVLNGRCTGPAPQLQLQMQYQLERVFGRVLGLAWSQTNDNVLMGSPTPTYGQALNWPIMHPIDILCGAYTYQCLPSPFTLRPDDIASLVLLYPVNGTAGAGKQASLQAAQSLTGAVLFPTGQGMAGVNVLVRRKSQQGVQEGFYESSAVSGATFKTNDLSPFVAAAASAQESQGTTDQGALGTYSVAYIPMQTGSVWQDLVVSTEAVNPLYFGPYSLQPFAAGNVNPSGSAASQTAGHAFAGGQAEEVFRISDAAATCGTGTDGSASAPVPVASSGWWNGLLCGQGHAAYGSMPVQPGRTLTVEVTALDEQGYATTGKAMPVIGIFAPSDGAGALPSVAAATSAFQALGLGTTSLQTSTGSLTQLKIGIADQRGAGRPDFAYQARVFYADRVLPETLAPAGGTVTISGMGFRQGNRVKVNGVTVPVVSAGSNSLTVAMPAMSVVNAAAGTGLDVTLADLSSGASSTITGALTYRAAAAPNQMRLVTAQTGNVYVGDAASVPFAVQVITGDGATPVVGQAVVFGTNAGSVTYGACGAASCTVQTDANGVATTSVTPQAAGAVTMTATAAQTTGAALVQSASFTAVAKDSVLNVVSTPGATMTVGSSSQTPFAVQALDANGRWGGGRQIVFSILSGGAVLSGCNTTQCTVTADYTGTAAAYPIANVAGAVTLQARDGDLTQTVSVQAVNVSDVMKVISAPPAMGAVRNPTSPLYVQLLHGDGATSDPFETVVYSAAAGLVFQACGSSTCAMTTDAGGYAGTAMVATQAGTYTITMSFGAVTQTYAMTFIVPAPSMRLVSAPAGNQRVGVPTNVPFKVQMLQADGVTPMNGASVAFAAPTEGGVIAECNRPACTLYTDGGGMVGASFIPAKPGVLTINANYGQLLQSTTFPVMGTADVMTVVASPGAGTFTGDTEAFAVQIMGPDGVTPAAGRSVTFTVTNGRFAFQGCGPTACTVLTDASGRAGVSGSATAAGGVSLMAADGGVTQTVSFSTTARPDVVRMVSGPAGTVMTSYAASPIFAVQVLQPDGKTPATGRTVTFAVTAGSVTFGACGGAPCTVVTDGQGMASTTVKALSAGATSVLAADGAVYVSDSFTAVLPDGLRIVSAPASGGYAGEVSGTPFSLQVTGSDGVNPAAGKSVTLSVTNGTASFASCGNAATCTLVSDANGMVSSSVTPVTVGTVTLAAADGPVAQTVSFEVVATPGQVKIVSAPESGAVVGEVAAKPLTVQALLGDGVTAAAGKQLTLSVLGGSAQLTACGASMCTLTSDASGLVTTGVTPLDAGTVTLSAAEGTIAQSTRFTAVAKPDVLTVASGPADGSVVGSVAAVPFSVRLTRADGVTARAGQAVLVSVTQGTATLAACGAASCSLVTDVSGVVSTGVIPGAAGTVALLAADGAVTQMARFLAVRAPDRMAVVSAPGVQAYVGSSAGTFAVKLTLADGVTPVPGAMVRFASAGTGQAQFAACGAAACSVTTDGSGVAQSDVTGLQPGAVTLTAAADASTGAQGLSAGLTVLANVYKLTATTPGLYVAEGASFAAQVGARATINGAPASGVAVNWTGTGATMPGGGTGTTDNTGMITAQVVFGPLGPGVNGTAKVCAWTTECASFAAMGVAASGLELSVVSGGSQAVQGGAALAAVVVQVTDAAGDGVAGAAVTISQTVSAMQMACPSRGRCPVAPVLGTQAKVLVSDAAGRVSMMPMTVAGTATETKLVITAGTTAEVMADAKSQP